MFSLAFAWFCAATFAASLLYFLYSYLFVFAIVHDSSSAIAGPLSMNVLLFSAFALHHSLFARTGLKQAVARITSPPLERSVYNLISSVLFVLVCWFWQPVPGVLYTLEAPWSAFAYAALASGVAITIGGARTLDVLELAGVRQVLRRSSDQTTLEHPELKTDGVYGFVRHPVYFGWILMMVGVPAMTMTRLTFAVISIGYLALAVPFEERSLRETFGPDYASYQRRVRWKMVPGLY